MAFIIIIALLIVGCVAYLVAGVQLHKKSIAPSNIVAEVAEEVKAVETKVEAEIEVIKPKAPKKAKSAGEKTTTKKVTKKK
jgi:Na+/H+ antiporter NhaC